MVVYNYSGKEINAKIVYYGPALSGKTTNLEWIYSKIPVEYSGKMVSLRTQADRTIFFDFLPLDLGMIDGFRTRFMLYTVPGQVHYNATRKMVLKGVDGLVFVADSEPGRMQDNIESLQNLRDNLTELGMNPDTLPLVVQWNKRDLPNCMTVAQLETELNPRALPTFEACALTGEGVYETLHKVCRLIYTKLTGNQVAAGEPDPPLFGESIAQCLQDVDVPQPEPEKVALGPDSSPARREDVGDDPLGAILGRPSASARPTPGPAPSGPIPDGPVIAPSGATPATTAVTREVTPLREESSAAIEALADAASSGAEMHGSNSGAPDDDFSGALAGDPPGESPSSSSGSDDGNGFDPFALADGPGGTSPVGAQKPRDIGGLVDEVLSSLTGQDDVLSVDASSSRPPVESQDSTASDSGVDPQTREGETPADDASVSASPLADKLDRFFDGMEPTQPVPLIRDETGDDDSAPSTSQSPSAGADFDPFALGQRSDDVPSSAQEPVDPATTPNQDGLSVEHDVDVFDEMQKAQSGAQETVKETPSGDFDLDSVLSETGQEDSDSSAQDLELITDPRKLPQEREASSSSHSVSPLSGMRTTAEPRSDESGQSTNFSVPVHGTADNSGLISISQSVPPLDDEVLNTRVLEVPVTVDAKMLSDGRPLRIVLNLSLKG